MKALVTGATGFVGGHLVDALLAQGDEVTVLVRTPARAAGLAERGVRLVPGDLGAPLALEEAVRGQEIVYHVAGLVAARSEAEFLEVNREGTARLLAAAARSGRPRFVLVSSLAARGPSARAAPAAQAEPGPVTAYGRSKRAAEDVVRSGRLPWTILRPPAVYGPADAEMFRVFRAARLGLVPVFGDGAQELSLVYGPDLARALAAVGRSERAAGGVYYPAHPEILTSESIARVVGQALGRDVRVVRLPRWATSPVLGVTAGAARILRRATILTPDKANELFAAGWTCDPGPLEAVTGWRARFDLASGAAETVSWYRKAGWL